MTCHRDEALSYARVLQTEMAMNLGRLVTIASEAGGVEDAVSAEAVAVLLTKNALHDPDLLLSVYSAAVQLKPVIPVCLIGHGYDYKAAMSHLSDLQVHICGISICISIAIGAS